MRVKKLTTFLDFFVGLMFKEDISPVYFETRFGIHTFFVKHPIDVIILNDTNTVIKMKVNLKPSKFFFWNPHFHKVIEAPANFIEDNNINIGGKIKLEFI